MSSHSSKTHASSDKDSARPRRSTPPQQAPSVVPPGVLQQAVADPEAARPADILTLQRRYGNHSVQRLLAGRAVQAKLHVGPSGDTYEQEADRVADQVMRMPALQSASPRPGVQRQAEEEEVQTKPLAAAITPLVQRQPEEEVQTKPQDPRAGFEAGSGVEDQLRAQKGAGSPLPDEVRAFMEPRFGADFGDVRVHADSSASELNRQLSAQAFTHGQDIYVSEGRYGPCCEAGKRLLAHELTHVVQQGGASVSRSRTPAFIQPAEAGTIQRWDENEHQYFGDQAAALVAAQTHKAPPTVQLGIIGGKVSFGKATQLGGDYTKKPEALGSKWATETGGWGLGTFGNFLTGLQVAATNVNHFFPLAAKEWRVQHQKALNLVQGRDYRKASPGEKEATKNKALVAEGFADHFLQDSYAAGHQYPHALNMILGHETKLGASETLPIHNALNKLTRGLPLQEGRFHGDHSRTPGDQQVANETANSLAEVVGAMEATPLERPAPHPSDGPDVPAILADREDDPGAGESPAAIWTRATGRMEAGLAEANAHPEKFFSTDAGTRFYAREIAAAVRGAAGLPPTLPPLPPELAAQMGVAGGGGAAGRGQMPPPLPPLPPELAAQMGIAGGGGAAGAAEANPEWRR